MCMQELEICNGLIGGAILERTQALSDRDIQSITVDSRSGAQVGEKSWC